MDEQIQLSGPTADMLARNAVKLIFSHIDLTIALFEPQLIDMHLKDDLVMCAKIIHRELEKQS